MLIGVWAAALVVLVAALSVVCCAEVVRADELPTDDAIEQMERELRDAYEARRKAAQDAGDDDARQAWLLRRRMIDAAISARELQDAVVGEDGDPPAEAGSALPVRLVLTDLELPFGFDADQLRNVSLSNYEIHGSSRYPVFIDRAGRYEFRNGVITGPGSDGDWRHGVYATRGSVLIEDHWFFAPTRRERVGRDHLVLYASGCPVVTLRRVMVGRPGDEHPHDFAIKIKSHADDAGRVTGDVLIEDVVVFGGRRVLLSVGNDAADAGVASARSVTVRRLLWVDPVGDEGGRLEALRFDGVDEVVVEELVVIDSERVLTKPRLVVAVDTAGVVSGRAYLPAALGDRPLVSGLEGGVELMARPPPGERPAVGIEYLDEWLAWGGLEVDDE